MTNEKEEFIKKLDELIILFEKLKKKATREGIMLENDPLYKNFEMLSQNYNMIKHNLPDELLQEIGQPMKEMIVQMVDQLKKEMGEDSKEKSDSMNNDLSDIDRLLKEGDLSEKEINDLLDKRSSLS